MTPDIEQVIERLDEVVKRSQMGYSERFEYPADLFYRQTGQIAPGKSLPLEMSSELEDTRRREAWDVWSKADTEATIQAIRASADALRASQWRPISERVEDNKPILRNHYAYGPMAVVWREGFVVGMPWASVGYTNFWPEESFDAFFMPLPASRASKESE